MSAPTQPVLTVSGLEVRRGTRAVVQDLDLSVRRGEIVAVLGPNGAGKSTLLETAGGLLKPARGTVARNGRVATVLQAPGLARRSVRANVELALSWWGVPRAQRRARATDALEQMRAGHLARRPAGSLSGGERRRVHLARGVALQPDLLLLDEPFAGLDPETHAALCEDTTSALRQSAGAVVVVVHDRADAWAMADRLLVMIQGRVVAEGEPRSVLAAPPSPEVAKFLGYDGELRLPGRTVLTRPMHVRIDPAGEHEAVVVRVVPLEDGVRVELALDSGSVRALHPLEADGSALAVGDRVRIRIDGGLELANPMLGA